jgi:hypothetical protein
MTASAWFSGSFLTALGWALIHFLWQGDARRGRGARPRRRSSRAGLRRSDTPCRAARSRRCSLCRSRTAWSLTARGRPPSPDLRAAPRTADGAFSDLASPVSPAVAGDRCLSESLRGRFEALRHGRSSRGSPAVLFSRFVPRGPVRPRNRLTAPGHRPATEECQGMLERLAARLAVTRPVKLLQSAVVKVPTAIGAFRPAILLPASVFTGLPTRGLEALIAHELAHVRRHDYLVNLVQTAAETLLFYHPAVWWVSARIRAEREQCCDDLAIAATGDARSYAGRSCVSRRCAARPRRSPWPRRREPLEARAPPAVGAPSPSPPRAGSRGSRARDGLRDRSGRARGRPESGRIWPPPRR